MGSAQIPNKLYIWRDQSLFISSGPIQSHVYKTAFHKLVVSLNQEIPMEMDSGEIVLTRSYLVKAGTCLSGSIAEDDSEKAVYYLPTTAQDFHALATVMRNVQPNIYCSHPLEMDLLRTLRDIQKGTLDNDAALTKLRPVVLPQGLEKKLFFDFDQRIAEVITLIETHYIENISISDLADQVHLSASRLEKLFKEQVGIPITTYRIRFRVFLGVIQLCMGASVTEAALIAGFSNLAHFSRSFAAVNGIQPTAIFAQPAPLDAYICKEIMTDPYLLGQLNGPPPSGKEPINVLSAVRQVI